MTKRYYVTDRNDWFAISKFINKTLGYKTPEFLDMKLTTIFGYAVVDMDALYMVVMPEENESLKDAIRRKYGMAAVSVIESLL